MSKFKGCAIVKYFLVLNATVDADPTVTNGLRGSVQG
jgi:hypothetical protein